MELKKLDESEIAEFEGQSSEAHGASLAQQTERLTLVEWHCGSCSTLRYQFYHRARTDTPLTACAPPMHEAKGFSEKEMSLT